MKRESVGGVKIALAISSCLLGEPVRYDGRHKFDCCLRDTFGLFVQWVAVCPEVEMGLPVPREPMHLVGDTSNPRLMTRKTGIDHTEEMRQWAASRLEALAGQELSGFVCKGRSPSCGKEGVGVYGAGGRPVGTAPGLFNGILMERFPRLPVEEDGSLHGTAGREAFMRRIFVYRRWMSYADADIEGRDGEAAVVRLMKKLEER